MSLPAGPARVRASNADREKEVDLIEDLYQLEGNQTMCSGGMAPDSTATVKLVFRVPEGDEAESLDVFNGDEPGDILGKTRIRVDA